MKIKLNFKLAIVLVSLFAGLLLLVLGSKSKYCLSFGLIFLGLSLVLLIFYINEKYENVIKETNEEIDNLEVDEEIAEEEKVYVLQELFLKQKKITKQHKRTRTLFILCGFIIILVGFFGMF